MVLTCLVIALAAATLAVTISRSRIFARPRSWPTRRMVRARLDPRRREWHLLDLLDALLNCPYCLVHWLVFVGAAIYQPQLVHSGSGPIDVVVTALGTIAIAAGITAALCRAYAFAGER